MSEGEETPMEGMLVAYVDGELDPAQRATVEEMIRADPRARAMVDTLRRSAAAVRHAFDRPLQEPVPARLLAAVATAGNPGTAAKVAMLRPRAGQRRAWIAPLAALAASIAMLFLGFGAGYVEFAPEKGIRPAGAGSDAFELSLYRALERDEAGSPVDYKDDAQGRSGAVTVVGSVATGLGPCREFRHQWTDARGEQAEGGIACRAASGDWSVLTVPGGPRP